MSCIRTRRKLKRLQMKLRKRQSVESCRLPFLVWKDSSQVECPVQGVQGVQVGPQDKLADNRSNHPRIIRLTGENNQASHEPLV